MAKFRKQRSVPVNTSGRVFEHIPSECVQSNPTLDAAKSLHINSSCMLTENLEVFCDQQCEVATPLQVHLLLHVTTAPSVETTAYSLSINISKTCVKRFEFHAGADIQIPTSSRRQTEVTIELGRPDSAEPFVMKHAIVDFSQEKTIETTETMLLPRDSTGIVVCTNLSTRNGSVVWKFPCVSYKRDAETTQEDYSMQTLGNDFSKLQERAQLLPQDNHFTIVSTAQAEQRVQKLEHACRELATVLHDCRRSTLLCELGATDDKADVLMRLVDWRRSYCVPSDTHLAQVLTLAGDIHNNLKETSSLAVDCSWLLHTDKSEVRSNCRDLVCTLLRTRTDIAHGIAGRRKDLQSVIGVRTSFLLLSAIDNAIRSACGMTQGCKNSLLKADDVACYAYWLGQMKTNTSNSVSMDQALYSNAVRVLKECERVVNSGVVLLPESKHQLSALSRNAWQHMHLQGLAHRDALVVASAPHFLYKQMKVLDLSKHPMVLALRRPTTQQLESAKLFAMLVAADVEHRIITKQTQSFIENQWRLACQGSVPARQTLCALFDPAVSSLINSVFDTAVTADISFLTQAHTRPPTTGYNIDRLTAVEEETMYAAVCAEMHKLGVSDKLCVK